MIRRGFTLLEVLVSLMVFAVAAVALGAAYVNVLNAYAIVGRSGFGEDDILFARRQLLAEIERKKAEEGADFDAAAGGKIKWRAEIDSTDTVNLFRVTFICESDDGTRRSSRPPTRETFMLLRPTWSDGVDTAKIKQAARDRILELRDKKPL